MFYFSYFHVFRLETDKIKQLIYTGYEPTEDQIPPGFVALHNGETIFIVFGCYWTVINLIEMQLD